MPANRFNGYTDLGIGIGLRVPHYRHILDKKPSSIGSRSSAKTTCAKGAGRWRCSTRFSNSTRWFSMASSMYFGSTDKLESRAPQATEESRETHEDAVSFRSSVLGKCRRQHTPTICCRCLIRSPPPSVTAQHDSRGAAISWKFRSAWKTSAAMPSITFRK